MAKGLYIGNENAKKVKKIYLGDSNSRKVKKGYIGVGNIAKLFYSSGRIWKKYTTNETLTYIWKRYRITASYTYKDFEDGDFLCRATGTMTSEHCYTDTATSLTVYNTGRTPYFGGFSQHEYTEGISIDGYVAASSGLPKIVYKSRGEGELVYRWFRSSSAAQSGIYANGAYRKYTATINEVDAGTVSSSNESEYPNNGDSGNYHYVFDHTNTEYSQGEFIENIEADPGTYPENGRHTDGYWYVLQPE